MLDIEFDNSNQVFYFTAYYLQKPAFPELFKRLVGSPMMHKIDDELKEKPLFRIYKQDWRPREQLDSEIEADNVLYTLIDTKNKLIYVGEASKLVKRLKGDHPTIKYWDFYRYDVLTSVVNEEQRVALERMLIRYLAKLIQNKANIYTMGISKYELANDKVDAR